MFNWLKSLFSENKNGLKFGKNEIIDIVDATDKVEPYFRQLQPQLSNRFRVVIEADNLTIDESYELTRAIESYSLPSFYPNKVPAGYGYQENLSLSFIMDIKSTYKQYFKLSNFRLYIHVLGGIEVISEFRFYDCNVQNITFQNQSYISDADPSVAWISVDYKKATLFLPDETEFILYEHPSLKPFEPEVSTDAQSDKVKPKPKTVRKTKTKA